MGSELLKKIVDSHSPEILEVTGLNADTLLSRHFAGCFLQPHNIRTHILFYVLLIRYLFSSVTNFLNYEHTIANPIPFGHGPWECLNPICTQEGKKIIQRCERKLKISGGFQLQQHFSVQYADLLTLNDGCVVGKNPISLLLFRWAFVARKSRNFVFRRIHAISNT